jgi:hypothetical protein
VGVSANPRFRGVLESEIPAFEVESLPGGSGSLEEYAAAQGMKGSFYRPIHVGFCFATYCRRTGRASVPDYEFYIAFNFFRLAAIFHGIKGRVIRGTAANAHAQERAESFPLLAEIAWSRAQRVSAPTVRD